MILIEVTESGSKSCCSKEAGTKFQVILWIPPTTFQHVYKLSVLQILCQFSLPVLSSRLVRSNRGLEMKIFFLFTFSTFLLSAFEQAAASAHYDKILTHSRIRARDQG